MDQEVKVNNTGLDAAEEASESRTSGEYFGDILNRRVQRRSILKGAGALGVGLVIGNGAMQPGEAIARGDDDDKEADPGRRIRFDPISLSTEDMVEVPENYKYNIILKWGDPLFPGAPEFDLNNQTRATQEQQFGFNCDFIGWYPLPFWVRLSARKRGGSPGESVLSLLGAGYDDISTRPTKRALLAVNHEYTSGYQMFPGYEIPDGGAHLHRNQPDEGPGGNGNRFARLVGGRDRAQERRVAV